MELVYSSSCFFFFFLLRVPSFSFPRKGSPFLNSRVKSGVLLQRSSGTFLVEPLFVPPPFFRSLAPLGRPSPCAFFPDCDSARPITLLSFLIFRSGFLLPTVPPRTSLFRRSQTKTNLRALDLSAVAWFERPILSLHVRPPSLYGDVSRPEVFLASWALFPSGVFFCGVAARGLARALFPFPTLALDVYKAFHPFPLRLAFLDLLERPE